MKIAYIIDGSTELTPSTTKKEDIYIVPFKGYNHSGELTNITNIRHLEVIQQLQGKQYIEPTPGVYRDVFKNLIKQGYDYIVCIPQNKELSSSYKFAEYASRFFSESVLVIDSNEYRLKPIEILNNLIKVKETEDESNLVQYTFEQLFDFVKNILVKVNIVSI